MRRARLVGAVGCLALSVVLGADASRGVQSPRELYACVAPPYKTLRLIAAAKACPKGQQKISWTVNQGEASATGSVGATATTSSFFSASSSISSSHMAFQAGAFLVPWTNQLGQGGINNSTADMSLSNDNTTLTIGTIGTYFITVSVSTEPQHAIPQSVPGGATGDTVQLLRDGDVIGSASEGYERSVTFSQIVSVQQAGTRISVRDVPYDGATSPVRLTGGTFNVFRIA
jgi:hypothetical protein